MLKSILTVRRACLWSGFLTAPLLIIGCASLQPLVESRPKAVDTYVAGVESYRNGDRQQAEKDLSQAVKQNPNLIMARSMLGEIYRSDRNYGQAIDQYEMLIRLDPYTLENHYYLGVCYQFVDRLQDAAKCYHDALKLNSNDANSNMNLGLVHLAEGRSDEAVACITKATMLAPNSAAAFANLGAALDSQKKYVQAETAYRRSIELDANQPFTLLNFGSNLVLQNKPVEAAVVFRQALSKVDSAWGHKRYGDALAMSRQYPEAIREYTTSLKINPRYYSALNEMGRTFIAQYEQGLQLDEQLLQSALAAWRKSLELNPNQPQIQDLVNKWSKPTAFGQ